MSQRMVIVAVVVIVVVFLVGFVPQYVRANRLNGELQRAQQGTMYADLRDQVALAYVQANEKNYGLAANTSARFFDQAHEAVNRSQDASRRKALEALLAPRDKITAALAKGDPAVMADLGQLFHQVWGATGAAGAR